MINVTNPDYFEESSLLRATQVWQTEKQVEEDISQNYQVFLEQVKRELSDLYATYGVEGFLDYAVLGRKLNPTQLIQYRNMINEIRNQNRGITDEGLILELDKLMSYQDLSIYESHMNIIEAYLVAMVSNNIEIVSNSLSQSYEFSYNHTLYDIHRNLGSVTTFERLRSSLIQERILSDWSGDTFIDAIKYARYKFSRDLKKSIKSGIRRNEVYQKIIKGLSKLVSGGTGYKSIRTILRQETTRIIGESTAKSYEQSGIQKYQFIATLDNRTTQICRHKDMAVYLLKEYEIGVNAPPMHYNCRSSISPYFEEDDLSKLKRTARDPQTGENYKVSASLSYKEWEEKFNK